MNVTSVPARRAAAARLLLPALLAVGAWVSAARIVSTPADRREVGVAHAQLRRALLATFEEEDDPARRMDAASLSVASLGDERMVAGVAHAQPGEDLRLGRVLLLGGVESIAEGMYEVRGPTSATAVDLVDSSGRVVATIPLDLPFSGVSDGRWQRLFFTVARWLSQRAR